MVPRPKMIEEFFSCYSNIDVHDHYRQGSLEMERQWETKKWYHRIFATVFGICIVDAFYAYNYEARNRYSESVKFTDFLDQLCFQMVNNPFLEGTKPPRRSNESKLSNDEVLLLLTYAFMIIW